MASREETKEKRKRKTVPRGTSPSHFVLGPESRVGPDFLREMPEKPGVDALLHAASSLFYRRREVTTGGTTVWVNRAYDVTEYSSLDRLMSPIRRQTPLEKWSAREIALFEAGMCEHGKDFRTIAKAIGTKSTGDVVNFYYICWKQSSRYKEWKRQRQLARERAKAQAPSGRDDVTSSGGVGADARAFSQPYLQPLSQQVYLSISAAKLRRQRTEAIPSS